MPEPETDKFRESPTLSVGLTKPEPYPIREFIYTTEDEAYQFREPNLAYKGESQIHDLPDGLQSDGTQPRHFGEVPIIHEDNVKEIRHNASHPGFAAVEGKIEGEGYSKESAGAILANASRHASKAAHKSNPRLNRVKG